jgi:hypothetical protein
MKIFSPFRRWLYLRLLRLYYWLQIRAARQALQVKRVSCSLLDAEIRYLKPDLLQLGEDDNLDLLVEYVSRQLTERELLPELGPVLGDITAIELIALARKSDAVNQVIARYHAADAFFAKLLKDDARRAEQVKLGRRAVPSLEEFDAQTVYQAHTKTVVRLRTLRKELAERSALKVQFSIEALSGGVALVSAIFVIAGFLYVRYFYGRLGIDVSLYFSAADYLAASVEQIRTGAFAAVVSLITFAYGVRAGSLRSRLHMRARAMTRRREGWAIALFTLTQSCASAYFIYIGQPNFSQLRLSGLVISYWVADYIAGAFFKNRLAAMTAIVGTLVFTTNVAVSAYERSELLLTGSRDNALKQQVLLKDPVRPVAGELIGANSSYYFVYSQQDHVTHVIPRERVTQIDITKLPQKHVLELR